MRNKKNEPSKRVRRPITTAPKTTKQAQPVQKEKNVTTLLFLGALAVAVTLALAVGTIYIIRGDASHGSAAQTVQKKAATAEQVMDAVSISLFTYGLDKNSIKEKSEVTTDHDTEVKMTIDPFHIEAIELRQTIVEKLTELGLEITNEETITAVNPLIKLVIGFTSETPVTKPKPNSIAFVIDDCGYNLELAEQLAQIPYPITMAIIPYTKYAAQTAKLARKYGKTVFLHQPMQPESYPKTDPGKGAVLLSMNSKQIKDAIDGNIKNIGTQIDGFNNHMGSALTQSNEKMSAVFSAIKQYTGTFVDSYTSKASVAFDQCKAAGFRCGLNRKFIDNEADYGYIRSKIIEGTSIAREDGSVIMIGHLREDTVHALAKIMPELEKAGYPLVSSLELTQK